MKFEKFINVLEKLNNKTDEQKISIINSIPNFFELSKGYVNSGYSPFCVCGVNL